MMPEQLPDIKADKGTQIDARNYAQSVATRVVALKIEDAIYQAYLAGAANGFRTGYKIGELRSKKYDSKSIF